MYGAYRITGATFGTGLRIGDAERSAAVEQLNQHYAAGRLTRIEHDERIDFALAARTRADLIVLLADLPDLAGPDDARRRRHRATPVLGAMIVVLFLALTLALAVTSFVLLLKALPILFLIFVAVVAFRVMRHHRRW